MNIRERLEAAEKRIFSPHAQLSSTTRGRDRPEPDDDMRTCFQRDRDRMLHSKAFRRLAHKTQVFLEPRGDHYRTRITHTLEVGQVARTIARSLELNEQLTEAIVTGHDLGHTPFGHAGEKALAHVVPGGYHHVRQSIRVVEQIERDGEGLNLTVEVRDGILKHSKGKGSILSDHANAAITLEGQIVRIADIVAYVNHDLDDAIRGGLLREDEVPLPIQQRLGTSHGQRLRTLIMAVIEATGARIDESRPGADARVDMHEDVLSSLMGLRDFLYQRVYEHPVVRGEFDKAQRILVELWAYFHDHADEFREKHWLAGTHKDESLDRAVTDFLAGMTDRYAMSLFEELRLPKRWSIF